MAGGSELLSKTKHDGYDKLLAQPSPWPGDSLSPHYLVPFRVKEKPHGRV